MKFRDLFPEENMRDWVSSNPEKFSIFLIRLMVGILWLSEAGVKIVTRDFENPDFDRSFFLLELKSMASKHPFPIVGDLINTYLVPNAGLIVWMVIFSELFIGTTILLGLFTRLGALIGMGMTINLWFFTLGWNEWIWIYPLIFTPLFIFFWSDSGRQIGLDRILYPKLKNSPLRLLAN